MAPTGSVGDNWLLHGGDAGRAEAFADKRTFAVDPGAVVRLRTPGR